jgi:hypothetical protein
MVAALGGRGWRGASAEKGPRFSTPTHASGWANQCDTPRLAGQRPATENLYVENMIPSLLIINTFRRGTRLLGSLRVPSRLPTPHRAASFFSIGSRISQSRQPVVIHPWLNLLPKNPTTAICNPCQADRATISLQLRRESHGNRGHDCLTDGKSCYPPLRPYEQVPTADIN